MKEIKVQGSLITLSKVTELVGDEIRIQIQVCGTPKSLSFLLHHVILHTSLSPILGHTHLKEKGKRRDQVLFIFASPSPSTQCTTNTSYLCPGIKKSFLET